MNSKGKDGEIRRKIEKKETEVGRKRKEKEINFKKSRKKKKYRERKGKIEVSRRCETNSQLEMHTMHQVEIV